MTFMVQVDDLCCYDTSDSSTPSYPPGFEPSEDFPSDDAISCNMEDGKTIFIPKRIKSECKRLGVVITDLENSQPRARRTARPRDINVHQ